MEDVDVVRAYLETVWSRGEGERAGDFIADSYAVAGVGTGPEAATTNSTTFRKAFPDLEVRVTDSIESDGRVAVWMRLSGTHRGTFRGHEATGRHVEWDEVGFLTVHDGMIASGRFLADMFGLRKALGVLSEEVR